MTVVNPYQAPKAYVGDVDGSLDEFRREHIDQEISVRCAGLVHYLLAIAMSQAALRAFMGWPLPTHVPWSSNDTYFMLALCAGGVIAGYALRALKPWAPIAVGVVSGIGMFLVPSGTLLHGYILLVVFSRKGRVILSKGYAAVRASTPGVRCHKLTMVWNALGLALVFLMVLLVPAL